MNIIVTGATGFLGSRVVQKLSKHHNIITIAHGEKEIFQSSSMMERKINKVNADVLLHCAAISNVTACEKNPDLSREVNLNTTVKFAYACSNSKCKFIACSSDQVYFRHMNKGESKDSFILPNREEQELNPVCIYGQHKLQAEKESIEINKNAVFLRLTWMYDMLTSQEIDEGRTNLLMKILNQVKYDNRELYSFADYRGVTNVNEVIENIEKTFHLPGGSYNFGSAAQDSMGKELVKILAKVNKEHLIGEIENAKIRNININLDKVKSYGIHFSSMEESLYNSLKIHI